MSDFWKNTLSNSAGVVLAALVIGFFGLIYEKANKYDDVLKRVEALEEGQKKSEDKLIDEIAELSVTKPSTKNTKKENSLLDRFFKKEEPINIPKTTTIPVEELEFEKQKVLDQYIQKREQLSHELRK